MVFRQVSVCVWAFIICTTWLRDGRRTHSHLLPRLAAFAFSVQPFWLWFLWLLLFFVGFAVFAWLSHSNLLEVGSYFFLHCHHAPQQNGSGWSSTCRNMEHRCQWMPGLWPKARLELPVYNLVLPRVCEAGTRTILNQVQQKHLRPGQEAYDII